MLDQMLGEQPPFDVARPAGGEVDDQDQALALVEGIVGVRLRRGERDEGAERDDGAHEGHLHPPDVSVVAASLTTAPVMGKRSPVVSVHVRSCSRA
jgi:hypothetical protein